MCVCVCVCGGGEGAIRRQIRRAGKVELSLLQIVHAIGAAHAADALVGGSAAAGAGGEVHLAFGVLVHQSVLIGRSSQRVLRWGLGGDGDGGRERFGDGGGHEGWGGEGGWMGAYREYELTDSMGLSRS